MAKLREEHQGYLDKASMYYAFYSVQRYVEEPFTSHLPESLFNISRYLLNKLGQVQQPFGISKAAVLFALAKQSRNLEAFKLARQAFEKLQTLKVPERFREATDVGCITIRSKEFNDKDSLLPVCDRCGATNPLLTQNGLICQSCRHPFVFSFYSFEILPLVEFSPDIDISDDEAMHIISNSAVTRQKPDDGMDRAKNYQGSQVMTLDDRQDDADDRFMQDLDKFSADPTSAYEPVRVDRETLKDMPSSEVFVQKWPFGNKYYRNVMPDEYITMCECCNQFFHSDDFELQFLRTGGCPFCKSASKDADVQA
jgi:intraflagellar transport protein 122